MTKIVKSKTVLDFAISKGCKTMIDISKFVIGKSFKTNGVNRSGHNYPIKFKIYGISSKYLTYPVNPNGAVMFSINPDAMTMHTTSLYLNEICFDSKTVDDMKLEISNIESEKKILEEELSICQELGIIEYDELLVKAVRAIDNIKKSKSKDRLKEAKLLLETIQS